jgi:hypothetical protein
MCFNAISFLIRTTQNYSKIFAGITLLFERISAFLERFQIYTATVSIDKRLKRLVHQLLQSFMRICNMSLKLTRSHKVLMYTKVFLFNTDEGVQKELEGLECLVKDEVNMSVALILQSAKMTEATVTVGFAEMQARFQDVDEKIGGKLDGVASQVEDLHAMVERGEKESKMKQNAETNRKAIQKAFSIPDKESWTTDHRNYVGALIDESGNWLVQGNADFMSWARAESNAKPAFAVEGKDGFGKSHLFSAVVRHLFSLHTLQVSNRRVAIAYFFMQNDGQEKQDAKESNVIPEKRGDSLDVALKSIIWQLTTKDAGYQKSVAAPCINFEEFGDIEDVWNRLVISLSSIDATFFILLDGIENIQSERGQRLLRIIRRTMDMKGESQRLRVQWFVTGSPSAFSSGGTVGLEESPLVTKLTLGTCNRDDLLSFTDMKMNTMKALAAKSDPEVLQLRSTIRERLVEGVAGNFTKLEYKLRDISTKTRKDEIEEVLTHVTEDIGDMIVRQLDRLNKDLEGKDVEDLNELLIWVVAIEPHMAWYLTVPLLDEVLYLKASSRSLVPLLERVKTSFAPLLEAWENPYEDDHCVGIAPSFLEHFKASQKLGKVTTSGYSSILHPSEIAIVERFLKNICDEELFRRFEFEEYFRQKSGKKKATIYVDIESVHVQMVTTLLSTLCSIPKANCKQLIEYAVRALPYHLSEEKWAKADQQSKRIVGSLLVRLLTDEEIINTVWAAHLQVLRYYWMAKDDAVKTVLAWFKDPATTLDIPEQKRAWIDNLTSNARLQDDLLKDAALVLAKRWLCRQTWSMVEEFEVLSTYYAKVSSSRLHTIPSIKFLD